MINEQCHILLGGMRDDLWWGKRVKPTEGAPASVAFNPDYVTQRDEKYKDVVGFIHTHPSFTAHYSSRDERTMQAWVCSLGKPLVCCIVGTDGLRAWWFLDDENAPVEYQAKSLRGLVFGLTPEEFFNEKEDKKNEHHVIYPEEEIEFLEGLGEGANEGNPAAESGVEPASEGCNGKT